MDRVTYGEGYARHVILGNMDNTFYTTDNNCVSVSFNFRKNVSCCTKQQQQQQQQKLAPGGVGAGAGVGDDAAYGFEDMEVGREEEEYDGGGDNIIKNLKRTIKKAKLGKSAPSTMSCVAAATKKGKTMRRGIKARATVYSTANPVVINRAKMILSERDTSQKQFTALKSRAPFFSVLKFETGAVIVVGLQDPALTKMCVAKAATDIADTLIYPISITNVSIVNTVSTFNRFYLNLGKIAKFFKRHSIAFYNPDTFPGMFFKLRVPAKRLESGETLGSYYTKVARMSDTDPNFDLKDWMRPKTVLSFKVGKNTMLGECGCDDVSIIPKLLFGLFHYFMDHNIKVTSREAKRLRRRYGIPPLTWYLYVDIMFHSSPYKKPSREDVWATIVGEKPKHALDKVYYGDEDEINAALLSNLVSPLEENINLINALRLQKLCGPLTREARPNGGVRLVTDSRAKWWKTRGTRKVSDPFDMARLVSSSESVASMMNKRLAKPKGGWWLDEPEFKGDMNNIIGLCIEEVVEECAEVGLIAAPFLRTYQHESLVRLNKICARERRVAANGTNLGVSNNNKKTRPIRPPLHHQRNPRHLADSRDRALTDKHRVTIARLETHMAAYRFLNKHLATGMAPKLAEFFGTDVYNLLQLVKILPKSTGHVLMENNNSIKTDTGPQKTPGDAYFTAMFDENAARQQQQQYQKQQQRQQHQQQQFIDNTRMALKRKPEPEKSPFLCSGCGVALIKGSPSVFKGVCQKCEDNSTKFIESALSDINRDTSIKRRHKERDNKEATAATSAFLPTARKTTKGLAGQGNCTPSDFIDSVYKFTDDSSGALKVGLGFKVKDILSRLAMNRGVEDRPTANYRTSLHSDTQNKDNLIKLLVSAMKENGATDNDAIILKKIIDSDTGLDILCELVGRREKEEEEEKMNKNKLKTATATTPYSGQQRQHPLRDY